ncbi:NlpC/P60 family protein [Burkholderia vietnamiensis]|uniref:NlpC/P60 family protein n=1 Tax=Burkholderia vietnamiensis TaxID=60552 RepID=UPI001B949C87|nr:NlpC/P60 family protein [Burkholderia vietnamiensis]MBR8084568.1 C40 family peptidase [Burkholderia vietnamiensis]MCA8198354.1 NlpC/P60 family protein [Burkholderia vietnamiensis]
MTPDDINRYVGLEWAAGARGPDTFDCWGLLRHVEAEHFGVKVPDVPELDDAARELYREQMASGACEIVPAPFHGAGVLMRGGDDPHVGVWLDCEGGGVLHSMERVGVIWSPRASLRLLGFSRLTFYRFHV